MLQKRKDTLKLERKRIKNLEKIQEYGKSALSTERNAYAKIRFDAKEKQYERKVLEKEVYEMEVFLEKLRVKKNRLIDLNEKLEEEEEFRKEEIKVVMDQVEQKKREISESKGIVDELEKNIKEINRLKDHTMI